MQESTIRSSKLVALWAIVPTVLAFLEAIVRLGRRAIETASGPLTAPQWAGLIVCVSFFAYVEGHLALQLRFAPAVVDRVLASARRPPTLRGLALAPLEALALAGGDGATRARAWRSVGLIVVAVFVVRALPSPWRGIVDAGVAAALAWGLAALVACASAALRGASARPVAVAQGSRPSLFSPKNAEL